MKYKIIPFGHYDDDELAEKIESREENAMEFVQLIERHWCDDSDGGHWQSACLFRFVDARP